MAPTGTGKTEAALIPLINRLLVKGEFEGVKILYITPLRALNRDLLERIEWWTSRFDMTVGVRHGDTGVRERRTQSLLPPTILITTPETLQILLTAKLLRQHLKRVEAVVIDEVHELAGDKRGSQLAIALERLTELCGTDFQRIGLSATVGSPETIASFLVGVDRSCSIVRVPVVKSLQIFVEFPTPVDEDFQLAEKLSVHPEVAARMNLIRKLVESHESTLVFTNTRPLAEILTNRFRAWDESAPIGIHHGSLSKTTRIGAEQALKTGGLSGVVCTSSLEMGIDVGRIELCIQYNSPREVTRLVQRVGRSGHTVSGTAKGVIIVTDSDDALEALVIARRAYNDMIEQVELFENSYDVLAHQLSGFLIERKQTDLDYVLRVFRQSYCFRNLSKEQLVKTAQHLEKLGAAVLGPDGTIEVPPQKTNLYNYYFNNLTMIPEEKQYLVVNESTGEAVGILDEEFVAEYGEPGTRFIMMGKAWEIIQTGGERIYVAALDSLEGAVPSWVGEEIPVPYEVAQEVGSIRQRFAEAYANGKAEEEISKLCTEYRTNQSLLEKALREVVAHLSRGLPVPSDTHVLLEETPECVVLHVCGGLKPNRTLARTLAYTVSEAIGTAVTVQQDAYRIVFKSKEINADILAESIKKLASEKEWLEIFKKSIESSSLFRRRLVHIARKMGMIAKEASILDINPMKLADMLKGTVVYEEALNHSLVADFDASIAYNIIREIVEHRVGFTIHRDLELTPLARLSVNRYASDIDVIASDRLQRLVVNAVRGRLNNEPLTLVCVDCWNWYMKTIVKEVEQKPKCPACGSTRLGVLREEPEEVMSLVARRGKPANKREKMIKRQATKTADLVEKYGKPAVFTLASKYIDVEDASEILEKEHSIGVGLVELIVEKEKQKISAMFAG